MHYTINNQNNKKIPVEVKGKFSSNKIKSNTPSKLSDVEKKVRDSALQENLKNISKKYNINAPLSSHKKEIGKKDKTFSFTKKFNKFGDPLKKSVRPLGTHTNANAVKNAKSTSPIKSTFSKSKEDLLTKTLSQKLAPLNKILNTDNKKVFRTYSPSKNTPQRPKPFVARSGGKFGMNRKPSLFNKPRPTVVDLKNFGKSFGDSFSGHRKPSPFDSDLRKNSNLKSKKFSKQDAQGDKKNRFRHGFSDNSSRFSHQLLGTIESVEDVEMVASNSFGTKRGRLKKERDKIIRNVEIPFEGIDVVSLANKMSMKLKYLKDHLDRSSIGYSGLIDPEAALLVAEEMGHTAKILEQKMDVVPDIGNEDDYSIRSPIVTIVGHVDHGKTSLLDALRKTNVVSGESGGITQSIGASQVFLDKDRFVTFVDTPGHEAFTSMRMRGVKITDIVVLVVAADDGIKDQTIEAISHIQSSGVPMIVCYTKIDKKNNQIDKIRQSLLQHNIVVESLGGDVLEVEVSAMQNKNLDKLLEILLLQAEMLDLKANSKCMAHGFVIESKLDKHRGPIATVLIKNGTLKYSDSFVVGETYGKVRAMTLPDGKSVKSVTPSTPVEIMGLNSVPAPGDLLIVVENEKRAKEVAEYRLDLTKRIVTKQKEIDILDYFNSEESNKINFILKADVAGSLEAIAAAVQKLQYENTDITIVGKGNGFVNESDVLLAKTSNSVILSFKVTVPSATQKLAKEQGVKIKKFSVIYELIDYAKNMIEGVLAPTEEEEILGTAVIKAIFVKKKIGTIAGCGVESGIIKVNTKGRVVRNGKEIYVGNIISLKQRQYEKKEIAANQEVGIIIKGFSDYQVGDTIESFVIKEIKKDDLDSEA